MLLYFVQNVFFKSKIILLCVIIAIQHSSSSKTSARKTQLAKQNRGRKRPLRKTRCTKFPVKLVFFRCLIYIDTSLYASPSFLRGRCHLARRFCTFSFIRSFLSHAVKPYFPNFLKVHERDSLLTLLWSGQYLVVFSFCLLFFKN